MLKLRKWKAVPIALMAISVLSACGKNKFQKLEQTSSGISGQYEYIKPKLDLIVFFDNSDSMANALNGIKPQLHNFLTSLDARWDYRFIVMPLQITAPDTQFLNNKYVVATDCTGIAANRCLSPSQASVFNAAGGDVAWINNRNSGTGNTDLGFQGMQSKITHLKSANFVRNDAILSTIVISNGEDVSGGVAYTMRPDGAVTGIDYGHATTINSFNSYVPFFSTIKHANPVISKAVSRFYSVVATQRYNGCLGAPGTFWQGRRYMDMAGLLGGVVFDVCQNQLYNVLGDISSHLQTIVKTLVFDHVVFPQQPDPATIVFKKNGAVVPNSAVNGWTYAGLLNNQPTSSGTINSDTMVFTPMPGNFRTGYMLRLHGTAELKGTDTYELIYTDL